MEERMEHQGAGSFVSTKIRNYCYVN